MSTHNIGFYGELTKIILELSLNTSLSVQLPLNYHQIPSSVSLVQNEMI